MMASVALDITIAVLLLVTIGYCWKLSRRITILHQSKAELNTFIENFNSAIIRAESNIEELKAQGETADKNLKEQINEARMLVNDLTFLADRSNKIADNLEEQIKLTRMLGKATPTSQQPTISKLSRQNTQPKEQAPEVTRQDPVAQKARQDKSKSNTMTPTKQKALEMALEQIASHKAALSRTQNKAQPAPQQAPPAVRAQPAKQPQHQKLSATTVPESVNTTIDKVFKQDRVEETTKRI